MAEGGPQWSLQDLGISPYRGNAYDLRVDLNYRNLQQLPPDLFALTELQWLNLNVNKFSDLPVELSKLGNLKWLYLENNHFERCPAVVCELTDLVRLYLSCNSLVALPAAFTKLTNLRWVDLSDNQFTDFPTPLCSGSLICLEKLFLDSNRISSLPAEIACLKSLKLLWLNDNWIEWLPHGLCELSSLEELQVKNNPLRSLPVYLTKKLTRLKVFEWNDCPLIQELSDACKKGLTVLADHQDKILTKAMQRDLIDFRTDVSLDGSRPGRPCYRMRTRPRGVAIIVDNLCALEPGENRKGKPSSYSAMSDRRDGLTDQDNTDRLRSVLIKLGFNVRIMRGLMSLDIISALRFLSLEDHSYFDCVIVCILSRGAKGQVIGPDGIAVEVQQLTDIFSRANCPTLADKPKLFFFQILESDVKGKHSPRADVSKESTTLTPMIPDDYDFLLTSAVIPSTAKSESSLQSVYHYYVGVLFDMLETFGRKLNLLDLLATVHNEVKRRRLRCENSPAGRVQISPEIQSTLRYNVYLSMSSSAPGQTRGSSKSLFSSRAATTLD